MRYFIWLLSSLPKSVAAMALLALLWASSCPSGVNKSETVHPIWYVLNATEDNLDQDKCIITKCALGVLRFHVANHQRSFNTNELYLKSEKNIVHTGDQAVHWVLTPNFYGSMTKEKFPETLAVGIHCKHYDPKKAGMPLSFLKEWLAIDPMDYKDVILIIATGIEGKLGVSEALKKALKDKKENGAIQDYKILTTKQAIEAHNTYVQEGKNIFTFIHTAG